MESATPADFRAGKTGEMLGTKISATGAAAGRTAGEHPGKK